MNGVATGAGTELSTFVLVHGAWHGGWCWAKVEQRLRQLGHETHAPTLTGLGERSHLACPEIDADLHVHDICNVICWRELQDVALVGHSYGGFVITGVASRMPESLTALVYLDALVPNEYGDPIFCVLEPERIASLERQEAGGLVKVEPERLSVWACDPVQRKWLQGLVTPHPIEIFRKGITLTGREREVVNKHYIIAAGSLSPQCVSQYERALQDSDWTADSINTRHDAMVEAPDELARMLHEYAETISLG